tara:strand:+ start:669 stop:953 length:285 start_codon:yes stop_codon:yes gene_type:complete
MTLLLYARRKIWDIYSLVIKCTHDQFYQGPSGDSEEVNKGFYDRIQMDIEITSDLNSEQLDRMNYIASRCRIHRILEKTIPIDITVRSVNQIDT